MAQQEAHRATSAAIEVAFIPPGIALVKLRGEQDISGKPRLREALATASAQLNVLVDLSECTFMDSSAISALFRARQLLSTRGGQLELVIPQEASTVQRIAKITALAAILPIHDSQSAALASFQPQEHSIWIRDLRQRYGDAEARLAQCACGWSGETRTSATAARNARRDGASHVDQQRIAQTARRARVALRTAVAPPEPATWSP